VSLVFLPVVCQKIHIDRQIIITREPIVIKVLPSGASPYSSPRSPPPASTSHPVAVGTAPSPCTHRIASGPISPRKRSARRPKNHNIVPISASLRAANSRSCRLRTSPPLRQRKQVQRVIGIDPTTRGSEDIVITFRPEATPEEEERFISELAYAFLALARHLVAVEEEAELDNIQF
jgi:hypothetical protein